MNFSIIFVIFLLFSVGTGNERVLPLLMPEVSTDRIQEDSYLCTAYATNPNEAEFITEFKPNASSAESLHHIMIIGCETLSEPEAETEQGYVWDCKYDPEKSCGSGRQTVLYAWSKNAPTYTLPDGVGFKVGGDTKINYLVLHIHYFNLNPDQSKRISLKIF